MRLFVFARHGQSDLNVEKRVNGDPKRPVALTAKGENEAEMLGLHVPHLRVDVCLHTRLGRSARRAPPAGGAATTLPYGEEPLCEDVRIGEFDGALTGDYRKWNAAPTRKDRCPNGESLIESAQRYADGYQKLLDSAYGAVLVVY